VASEVFDRLSGLEILAAQLRGDLPRAPLDDLAGLRLVDAADGRAVFSLPASPWLRSEAGTVFGGMIGLLANSATAAAVQTTAPAGTAFTALDLKVNFLHQVPADGGELVATGTVVHRGRRLVIATADVVNGQGRRVALATGTTMLRRQSGPAGSLPD
jgi:acyl-CoA thioesterase